MINLLCTVKYKYKKVFIGKTRLLLHEQINFEVNKQVVKQVLQKRTDKQVDTMEVDKIWVY